MAAISAMSSSMSSNMQDKFALSAKDWNSAARRAGDLGIEAVKLAAVATVLR